MKYVTVYRTGGDFNLEYVLEIFNGISIFADDAEFVCLTDDDPEDIPGAKPLKHNWPGWWSKMEMYRLRS